MRRRKPDPINQIANQPLDVTQGIPRGTKIETGKTNSTQDINSVHDRSINNINPFVLDVPLHSDLLFKPLTQQNANKISYDPNINLDFEENSPFQEGLMSEMFHGLDKLFFQNPKELGKVINKENLIHKFLPRQADTDKILKIIQRKVLRGTYLLVEIKEIQAGYLQSPYFKHLYQYLLQNKLPSSKEAIKKLEALSEKYVLLDSLLFRIYPEKETVVLAVPETWTDKIITLYHKNLFAGHQ